jgi:transglutaminase-like putative cysteine protease
VLLFVLFPRIPGPFWAIPNRAMSGVTGLAETISPGDISALSLSDEVVFRARFESGVPRTEQLYWRGPVLERFDGRTWSAASRPARARALPRKQTQGPVFGYQLVLEPQGKPWLLALESPLSWSMPHAYLSPALQLLSPSPLQERVSYRARSQAGGRGASEADAATLETNLRLPPGVNPRSIEFAARLRATTGDDGDYVREILRRFGTDGFRYTLEPPPLGTHPVDQFLFDARAGFCEHYASAMALLLRAGGIPARVVVGYQGGERNPFGDYWIVRQANAHAWVEAWLQGAWQRLDPTASVAPERIERGYAADTGSTLRVGIPLWRHDYLARAVLSWDALNAAWDRWVLAYGPEAQDELLLALGFEVPRSTQLAGLAAGASAICLLLMAYALRHHRSRRSDPALRCYERFTATLAPVVRPRRPAESAQHYARSVCALRPDLAREVTHITDLYLRIRYGGHDDPHSRRELVRAIRRFRPPPRPAPA